MKADKQIVLHASSMHRYMRCSGAYWLEKEHGIDETGKYAEEGTRQHKLCADVLYGLESEETLSREDWDLIKDYIDVIRSESENAEMFRVEETLFVRYPQYSEITVGGTPDAWVYKKGGKLQIHDRKLPFGVTVGARGNEQLLTYAYAILDLYFNRFVPEIEFYIHQGKDIRQYDVKANDLVDFQQKLDNLSLKLLLKTQDRNPSEIACRYCTAKHVCPELRRFVEDVMEPESDCPTEYEQNAYQNVVSLVRAWCDSVEKHTYRMLMAGKKLADWKLVQSRAGPRKWIDEKRAEQSMHHKCGLNNAQIYERKLISPTKCEKQFPDQYKLLEEDCIVERTPGAPTVVKRTDKRPELDRNIDFEDLTQKA